MPPPATMAAASGSEETTEQRVLRMLQEHETGIQKGKEKTTMLQEAVKQMAIRMDEMSVQLMRIDGQPEVQSGSGPEPFGYQQLKAQIEEMGERAHVDPRTVDDLVISLQNLKDHVEHVWAHPVAPGLERTEREFEKKNRGWDTRKLMLDPFDGDKKEFRNWSFTLKAFIRRECPGLESYMTEIEYQEEEIDGRHISDAGVDLNEDKELAWVLTNYTAGEVKEMVQLNESKRGCEIWRIIVNDANPKSGTSGVQAMQQLMAPGRAKTYSDLKKMLAKWDALLKAEVQRGGPASKIGEEVKATAIISMVPKSLELEIMKKGKKMVESFKDIRTFVDDMVYMHTIEGGAGGGISLANVEDDDIDEGEVEINDEQGNVLVGTIMMRNGKRIFQPRPWRPGGKNGGGKGGKNGGGKGLGKGNDTRECFRCNRKGHVIKDCWSTTKADGSKIVDKPKINNLNAENEVDLQSITLANIETENLEKVEINVLEANPNFCQNSFMLLAGEESDSEEIPDCSDSEEIQNHVYECPLCGSYGWSGKSSAVSPDSHKSGSDDGGHETMVEMMDRLETEMEVKDVEEIAETQAEAEKPVRETAVQMIERMEKELDTVTSDGVQGGIGLPADEARAETPRIGIVHQTSGVSA